MEIGSRIRFLRLSEGLTQKRLGESLGVSDISVRSWESGAKKPSVSALADMANLFNVSADYILGINGDGCSECNINIDEEGLLINYRALDSYGKDVVKSVCAIEADRVKHITDQRSQDTNKIRYIPKFLSPSAAGKSAPIDNSDFNLIPVDKNTPKNADFAVIIQGDSMSPYIHDGDTVFIQKTEDISIGDIGIFCVDGVMYCKHYYKSKSGDLILVSANPEYKDTNVKVSKESSSEVRCYGKVLLNRSIKLPDYF